jgi:N-hydroxyarylamine O-acetyltransferase
MNVDDYLKRINYSGPLSGDAETLRNLQVAHLRSVPFENLSIHSGEPIVLNDEALFRKIVEKRRGGFCYELNGLFTWLLRQIGFDVSMLSAGVADSQGGFSPDFDHMTLVVTLNRRWLVDVGFGDSFVEPLLLDEENEQQQGTQTFRIISADSHLVLMRRSGAEEWKPQYRFTLQPYQYADYEEMCRYHQTSPQSHFTKSRLCSLATSDGRITLSGMRLIKTSNEIREEETVENEEEYEKMLRDRFGIVMKLGSISLGRT